MSRQEANRAEYLRRKVAGECVTMYCKRPIGDSVRCDYHRDMLRAACRKWRRKWGIVK